LVFEKNANFFRRKLAKIAENCDHNIDPWTTTSSKRLNIFKAYPACWGANPEGSFLNGFLRQGVKLAPRQVLKPGTTFAKLRLGAIHAYVRKIFKTRLWVFRFFIYFLYFFHFVKSF
jgi:hypothetical protein